MRKIALAIGTCTILLASPALAAPAAPEALRVSYSDLDLNNTQDAGRMLSRLRVAVLNVCADRMDIMLTPTDAREMRNCRREVMGAAVARIGSTELKRLYEGRTQQTASR
jgi:UrcA family protein